MIEALITLGLSLGVSIIGIYLRKAYIESEIQEEIKNKQETENLVVRNKKIRKAKKDLFNSVISSNEKGKQEAQKELQRLLNSDAAKEVAEAAKAIGSIYRVEKGLGGVPKMRNVPPPPKRRLKRKHIEGGQDNSTLLKVLNMIENELIIKDEKTNKKFKKQEVVNDNIHDPITGELLNIVQCSCKTISDKDSYLNYGCPNCGEKIINKK